MRMNLAGFMKILFNTLFATKYAVTLRKYTSILSVFIVGIMSVVPNISHAVNEKDILNCPQPKPFSAEYYTPRSLPIRGNVKIQLIALKEPNHYYYESKVSALWQTQTESSHLVWGPGEFFIKSYYSERKGFGKKKENKIIFDQNKKKMTYYKDDQIVEKELPSFIVDTLSEQLLVSCLVKKGYTNFEIPTFTKGELAPHSFKVVKEEKIKTGEGSIATYKVEKIHRSTERTTILWLSKEHPYLIVKIEQNDNRKKYSILLDKLL